MDSGKDKDGVQQLPPDTDITESFHTDSLHDQVKCPDCKGAQLKNPAINRQFCLNILKKFSLRFLRQFVSGVVLYSGVRIVYAFLRNRHTSQEIFPNLWRDILSKDCARVATFCALYPSIYQMLVEVIGALKKHESGWRYGISGGLAGLSVAVLDKSRRQTLAFFSLSRALGAGLSTLVTRGYIKSLPFCDLGVFCACVSLIVYCVALRPQYLSQGYYRSILKWSRDYTDNRLDALFREPGPRFLTCQEVGLHKGQCVPDRLMDFLQSLPSFAKLYLPIHVAPVIMFKRKTFMENPLYVIKSLLKNLMLSTIFLGLIAFLVKVIICVLRNLSHRPPPIPAYIPLISGALCGTALLLERRSRRKELTLFVIPQILTVVYNMVKQSKLGPSLRLPHGFTLMFALSMMSVMHAYEREPESLTLLINGVLNFFVGPRSSANRPGT